MELHTLLDACWVNKDAREHWAKVDMQMLLNELIIVAAHANSMAG
jgi:hypothetical protein